MENTSRCIAEIVKWTGGDIRFIGSDEIETSLRFVVCFFHFFFKILYRIDGGGVVVYCQHNNRLIVVSVRSA